MRSCVFFPDDWMLPAPNVPRSRCGPLPQWFETCESPSKDSCVCSRVYVFGNVLVVGWSQQETSRTWWCCKITTKRLRLSSLLSPNPDGDPCWRRRSANVARPALNLGVVLSKLDLTALTLDSYPSLADARHSRFVTHSSRTNDHWPSTLFFHSVRMLVKDSASGTAAGAGGGGGALATGSTACWMLWTRLLRALTLDWSRFGKFVETPVQTDF